MILSRLMRVVLASLLVLGSFFGGVAAASAQLPSAGAPAAETLDTTERLACTATTEADGAHLALLDADESEASDELTTIEAPSASDPVPGVLWSERDPEDERDGHDLSSHASGAADPSILRGERLRPSGARAASDTLRPETLRSRGPPARR